MKFFRNYAFIYLLDENKSTINNKTIIPKIREIVNIIRIIVLLKFKLYNDIIRMLYNIKNIYLKLIYFTYNFKIPVEISYKFLIQF